jgi:hypothetical protein
VVFKGLNDVLNDLFFVLTDVLLIPLEEVKGSGYSVYLKSVGEGV